MAAATELEKFKKICEDLGDVLDSFAASSSLSLHLLEELGELHYDLESLKLPRVISELKVNR